MATASVPVDLFNPGQVFACLGLMELAEILCGSAEAGFDWSNPDDTRFVLRADGNENPITSALDFLASAELLECAPVGYQDLQPKKTKAPAPALPRRYSHRYMAPQGDRMTLSALFESERGGLASVSHWTEPETRIGRASFKLYAGNRSGCSILNSMLRGKGKAPGVAQVLSLMGSDVAEDPFGPVVGIGGSFNLDPRGAWTALDAGYSPDKQNHSVAASPLVEILGVIGLQHSRPEQRPIRHVRYCTWSEPIPSMLARATFGCAETSIPVRTFAFTLDLSGKNKVVTFSQEETH